MARFQITSAVEAHPLGVPLFSITLLSIPLTLFASLRALPVAPILQGPSAARAALVLSAAAAITWVARLLAAFTA
jgi:hypothetical protein